MNPRFEAAACRRKLASLGIDLRMRAAHLSGGQRAQVALALALAKRPRMLILDEPVASLDPLARREFLQSLMEAVAAEGTTVVLSSHLISDLERVCDYLVVLSASRVQVLGEIDELLDSHAMLSGPASEAASLPTGWPVIGASTIGRQTTILARTNGVPPQLTQRWVSSPVSLDELVLAYMRNPGPRLFPGRLVGGDRMTWVAWRQLRTPALTGMAAFTLLGVFLLLTGLRMSSASEESGLAQCLATSASPTAASPSEQFRQQFGSVVCNRAVLPVHPGTDRRLLGRPTRGPRVRARNLRTRLHTVDHPAPLDHRQTRARPRPRGRDDNRALLASCRGGTSRWPEWTAAGSRQRYSATKASSPLRTHSSRSPSGSRLERSSGDRWRQWPSHGRLLRRPVPDRAMGAAPLPTTAPPHPPGRRRLRHRPQRLEPQQPVHRCRRPHHADATRRHALPAGTDTPRCLAAHGYRVLETFQPANRFWAFQAIEAGIFVTLDRHPRRTSQSSSSTAHACPNCNALRPESRKTRSP